ncbi:MAG TPA: hypothetical protein VFF76_02800 [Holophagaceae bacterium]|jgi:hypothetical protein|nr:hypothetical protein [Holophagaceae bacterium]
MNGSTSKSPVPFLLGGLLAANLGLLWIQGAQLNRQHDTLRQIHTDIEELTDALDAYTNGDSSGDSQDGSGAVWAPASRVHARRHAALVHARYQEPQPGSAQPANPPAEQDQMDQGRKDIEDANKSARDAVAKAREDQHKLSISENYRKGQEERKIQEAQYAWTRWVWAALAFLILAFAVRAWIIKRNG